MRLEPSNNFFHGLLEWGRRVTAPQPASRVEQAAQVTPRDSHVSESSTASTQKAMRPVGTRGAHLDVYA
jgi:hypothetical protein